jgi:HSP20 family protein
MTRFRPSEWRREFLEAPIKSLQGELNRLFEEYWDPERPAAPGRSPTDLEPSAWVPPVDLYESADELTLRVDLPGVDPASVELSLTGTVLDIRGDRSDVAPEGAEERIRQRPVGSFHRQINLPEEVAFDEVQAECKHGVLAVRLPKRRDARPRTIPIRPN